MARKPEQAEGARTLYGVLRRRQAANDKQPSLVRMPSQSIALHPLYPNRRHPLDIIMLFKTGDEVIAFAGEGRLAFDTCPDCLLELHVGYGFR